MEKSTTSASRNEKSSNSLRLIIAFSENQLRLIRIKRVHILAPVGEKPDNMKNYSGSWAEIRDLSGKSLYKRIIHESFEGNIEVQTGRTDEPFAWQKTSDIERLAIVLLPELPDADHVAIFRRSPDAKDASPLELGHFSLKI